jgi:hypothetical protein
MLADREVDTAQRHSRFPGRAVQLAILLAFAGVIFLTGIHWGLPSRAVDPYLFGRRTPWTGAEILQLSSDASRQDSSLGADVDRNPLVIRDVPIVLNGTDAERAEIVRRYRLYTYQPDEMITLMALAGMSPGRLDLDPKLYQYGGLWIYPVGGLLQIASKLNLIHLTSDLAYYLDHPEAFGRFYVVARLYTVFWGLVGVVAVYCLSARLAQSAGLTTRWLPAAAALAYMLLPVVVNMAHEAKPHLPGAVLMLLAVLSATHYVQSATLRNLLTTGVLCGAAFGMVISSLPIFSILPVMVLLNRAHWLRNLLLSTFAGGVTYVVTNPYVLINFLTNRALLRSNLDNSTAMYNVGNYADGFIRAAQLLLAGGSFLLIVLGTVASLVFLAGALRRIGRRHERTREGSGHEARGRILREDTQEDGAIVGENLQHAPWLLATPAILIALQFLSLAAGKPAEYARFAIFPDIALAIAALFAVAKLPGHFGPRIALVAAMLLVAAIQSFPYLRSFHNDTQPQTSRLASAADIQNQLAATPDATVAILAEPAPYSLPPVDLFNTRLLLLPASGALPADPPDLVIRLQTENARAPISWADRHFALDRPSRTR